MKPLAEQKCPACTAPMRFDPGQGKLVCDYCGMTVDIPADPKSAPVKRPGLYEDVPGKIQGFDFKNMTQQVTDLGAQKLPIYNCVSCGAEVIAPAEQMALTCPYCGNNIVLTEKVTGGLRPNSVIPFRIQPDSLPAAVSRFHRWKSLLPRGYFSKSTMGKVTGVYVPFWVFRGKMSGTISFNGQKSSSHRSGSYLITKTDHYVLTRRVSMSFEDVPVDASGKIKDEMMDSLEPFEMQEAKDFDIRYLAGFTADRFDVAKSDISARAERRMRSSADSVAMGRATSGYSGVSRKGGTLKGDLDAKYVLFPVYLFDLAHEGKNYHYADNGQTGKVVGQLPIDKNVSRLYFLLRFGVVSLAMIAFFVGKYLLGG